MCALGAHPIRCRIAVQRWVGVVDAPQCCYDLDHLGFGVGLEEARADLLERHRLHLSDALATDTAHQKPYLQQCEPSRMPLDDRLAYRVVLVWCEVIYHRVRAWRLAGPVYPPDGAALVALDFEWLAD
jgi:hypothetical protein